MAAPITKTKTPGVFRRGGRYVVPYREPEGGSQRWPSFRTYEEARRFKRQCDAELDRGEFIAPAKITLRDYLLEWIDRYVGGRRGFRDETREEYRALLHRYALLFFGDRVKLTAVTPVHVARFVGWLCDEFEQARHDHALAVQRAKRDGKKPPKLDPDARRRLSDKTVRNILVPLRAALATARREGLIRHNPCDAAQLPNRPEIEEDDDVRALTRKQLAVLLNLIHPTHRLLFRFLAATGLRISEAIGVEWRHLHLDGHGAHVRVRQRVRGGKVGAVKSRHSRRSVPLPASIVAELRAWHCETDWLRPGDPVFASEVGTPLSKDNLRERVLKPAKEEADVAWCGLHTLRHTFASMHIERGTNVVQLSKLLGHHSAAFTLSTYAHLLDAGVGDALDLDAELANGANKVQTSAAFGASRRRRRAPAEIAD